MGVQLPSEPINRHEQYLAKIAGQAVDIPAEPITREEAYLDYIAKHGGGGGGGTNDYDDLLNQPKINDVTLKGNKSLSDLGIASASALANKVDKVAGKGLSTNDYSNEDKAIVGGVTAALADKVDKVEGKGLSTNDYDNTEKQKNANNATAITGIKNGTTINDFAGVETVLDGVATALATKQNATDNNLETDAKTIVGAINEHEGDVSSLKSGLTTLDTEVNGDATVYPYADVITILDSIPANLADCSVKIEPVQDLHGYDKPWVGGAGNNKLDTSTTTISNITFTEGSDYYVTASPNNGDSRSWGYSSAQYKLKLPAGNWKLTIDIKVATTNQSNGVRIFDSSDNSLGSMIYLYSVGIGYTTFTLSEETEIGVMSKIYDAEARFRITASTINNWSPYTNICPITGHIEASVQRDGVNQWEFAESYSGAGGLASNLTFSNALKPNTYTMSCKGTFASGGGAIQFTFLCEDGSNQSITLGYDKVGDTYYSSGTITKKIVGVKNIYSNNAGNSINDVQLELGSTITPFEPYQGKTYTINLNGTVYGGTVDFDSGVMTVDRAMLTLDGTEQGWSTDVTSGGKRRFSNAQLPSFGYTSTAKISALSNIFENTTSSDYDLMDDVFILRYINGANRIDIMTEQFADTTELTTFLGTTNMQVLYMLATPTTVQLTPQQIQLLKGTNTITASTGQISVTVNGVSGAIGAVQEQANATDAALAELAEQLPSAPTTDGAYVLTVTVADGTPTYSWESAT